MRKRVFNMMIILGVKWKFMFNRRTGALPSYGAGNLIDVHAAGAGIEDIFVDTALLVDLLGLATLHHMTLFEHVDVVGIDNLTDVV